MTNDLDILQQVLDQASSLQSQTDLTEALDELFQLAKNSQKPPFELDNYLVTSGTLKDAGPCSSDYQNLVTASHWLKDLPESIEISDLLHLNQLVLGLSTATYRTQELSSLYPFPHPSSIPRGLELLQKFIKQQDLQPVFQKIAYIQALLSLHPFENGNNRTCRLLLDHWFMQLGLSSTYFEKHLDFIMANPKSEIIFSLRHAVILCLQASEKNISRSLKI